VSVETIYKAFGGKPGLVRAIVERGLAGAGAVPAPERSDQMQQAEDDPRKIIAAWGTFTTEVAPLVSPILLLVRDAAATDPDMANLQDEVNADRLERMTHNARNLYEAGYLRPGITLEMASDVLWTYSSPELYELLVLRRGWSPERYGRFVAEAMTAALLPS
jgi:AcrR family transcriptional regulator